MAKLPNPTGSIHVDHEEHIVIIIMTILVIMGKMEEDG